MCVVHNRTHKPICQSVSRLIKKKTFIINHFYCHLRVFLRMHTLVPVRSRVSRRPLCVCILHNGEWRTCARTYSNVSPVAIRLPFPQPLRLTKPGRTACWQFIHLTYLRLSARAHRGSAASGRTGSAERKRATGRRALAAVLRAAGDSYRSGA